MTRVGVARFSAPLLGAALTAAIVAVPAPAGSVTTKPGITALAATPKTLTFAGGSAIVTATLSRAAQCTLSAVPALTSGEGSFDCSAGSVSRTIEIPANPTGQKVKVTISLEATNKTGSKTASTKLTVAATPRPTITSLAASPPTISTVGGTSLITATTSTASSCSISSSPDLLGGAGSFDCSQGSVARTLSFPRNQSGKKVQYVVGLTATGPGGTRSLTTTIAVAPGAGGPASIGATKVSVGYQHSCAVLTDTTLRCWGRNFAGDLGDGTTTDAPVPTTVVGESGSGSLSGVIAVSAGGGTTCAVLSDHSVDCWGANYRGSLGSGSTAVPALSTVPRPVVGLAGAGVLGSVDAIAGGAGHFCALLEAGSVACWGDGAFGQTGTGSRNGGTGTPTLVVDATGSPLTGAIEVVAGSNHSCALLGGGSVACWGADYAGQLGSGVQGHVDAGGIPSFVKVAAPGGSGLLGDVLSLAAGGAHSCALRNDGSVLCWGSNASRELGDGSSSDRNLPVSVLGVGGSGYLGGVTALSASGIQSCAAITDGGVLCWGSNASGALGDGTMVDRATPTAVLGIGGTGLLAGTTDLSASGSQTCSLRVDRSVLCWGLNDYGQLGDGTTVDRSSPTQAVGL